jgi:hypothetical protein
LAGLHHLSSYTAPPSPKMPNLTFFKAAPPKRKSWLAS